MRVDLEGSVVVLTIKMTEIMMMMIFPLRWDS